MPRTTKQSDDRPFQDYPLGNGATVRVLYVDGQRPAMLLDDNTALVSFDADKYSAARRAILMGGDEYVPPPPRNVTQIPTRSRDLSPAARAEMLAQIEAPSEPAGPRPMTSADVFAAAGLDPKILGALELAAESS